MVAEIMMFATASPFTIAMTMLGCAAMVFAMESANSMVRQTAIALFLFVECMCVCVYVCWGCLLPQGVLV